MIELSSVTLPLSCHSASCWMPVVRSDSAARIPQIETLFSTIGSSKLKQWKTLDPITRSPFYTLSRLRQIIAVCQETYLLFPGTLYSIFVAKDVQAITVTAVSADPGANISAALPSGETLALTSGETSDPFAATSGGILAITVTVCFDSLRPRRRDDWIPARSPTILLPYDKQL